MVAEHFGGISTHEEEIRSRWLASSARAKAGCRSIVIPLGSLDAGTSRHRALLFKLLADSLNLRCQLVKGKFFGGADDSSINMVTVSEQQYLLDLMSYPGRLVHPEEYATLARRRSGGAGGAPAAAAAACCLHLDGCLMPAQHMSRSALVVRRGLLQQEHTCVLDLAPVLHAG
jgi:hypothetical protein